MEPPAWTQADGLEQLRVHLDSGFGVRQGHVHGLHGAPLFSAAKSGAQLAAEESADDSNAKPRMATWLERFRVGLVAIRRLLVND